MRATERPLSSVGPQVVQEVVQLDEGLLASLNVALEQRLLTGRSWVAVFEDSERPGRRYQVGYWPFRPVSPHKRIFISFVKTLLPLQGLDLVRLGSLLADKDALDAFVGQRLSVDCHYEVNALGNTPANTRIGNSRHSKGPPIAIGLRTCRSLVIAGFVSKKTSRSVRATRIYMSKDFMLVCAHQHV